MVSRRNIVKTSEFPRMINVLFPQGVVIDNAINAKSVSLR